MVRLLLAVLALAASLHAGEQARIALYVAIDEYHSDPTIRDLRGCVNDMERLAATLSDGYGFRPYRLLRNKDATRDGIRRGLWWLMEQTEKAHQAGVKDIVVVFGYAGHGSVLKSASGDEKWDTTIIPSDGGKRAKHHIRDDDVNRALGRIQAEFGATVVYIRDSCHSGTSYRAAEFAGTRGVMAAGETPASSNEASIFAGEDGRPTLPNRPNDRIVYLGAAFDTALSEEGLDPTGKPCGKFSWSLTRVLAHGREGTTYAELHNQLITQFRKDWPDSKQIPPAAISTGLKDMKCFGSRRAPPHARIAVRRGSDVELSQGALHGVVEGSVFRFYKDLTDLEDDVRELTYATVTDVADVTCTARLAGALTAPSAVARLDRVQFADFKVGLLDALPPSYERVLTRLKMPVAKDAYAVALEHRDGRVYVYDPARLPGGEGAGKDDYLFEATSPALLEDILARHAGIRRLLALERNEGLINVTLRPHPGHENKELAAKDGMHRFANGAPIDITVENTRPHAIHVFAFLDERSLAEPQKREFGLFWPMGPGYTYRIEPGKTLVLTPPDGEYLACHTSYEGGARFTVKLLITEQKYDAAGFAHLTQRTGVRSDMDDLQRLLGNLGGGGGNRDATAALRTWWGTASIVFEVGAHDGERGTRGMLAGGAKTGGGAAIEGYYEGRPVRFGRYHALLVGINRYAESTPWADLFGPVSDVDDLRALLTEQFGFHVKVVKDGDATSDGILGAIRSFQKEAPGEMPAGFEHTPLGEGDNLLVWYAGHGRPGAGKDADAGYWLPYGSTTENATWLSFEQVRRELGRVAAATDHVLLVSDSCFSGGLSADAKPVEMTGRALETLVANKSFQIMTSGDLEVVADVYKHGNSPFASAFKRALRAIETTHLATGKPFKTAWEITAEIRREVSGQTPTGGYATIEGADADPGEFVFALRRYFETPDEMNRKTSTLLRKFAVAKGQLDDGRPLFALRDSRDEAPMVLVRGSLKRRRPVRPFLVDRDEVTVERFRRFVADQGRVENLRYLNLPPYGAPEQPVVGVSFEAARAFAAWAGKSLPTEAEWQAAAGYVAGRDELRAYPWGDELPGERPRWTPFPPLTTAVTTDVSPWGARGMATGVREWCRTVDEAFDRAVICGGTQVVGSLGDRADPADPFVPESMLRCDYRAPTRQIRVPYRNVGFRCVKRLR